MKNKNNAWWQVNISSADHARETIAEVAWLFVVLGIVTIIVSFLFLYDINILEGIVYVYLGSLLGAKKSRSIGLILILIAMASLLATGYNRFTGAEGGKNIWLAIIVAYSSVKAFLATRYLVNSKDVVESSPAMKTPERWGNKAFPLLSLLSSILLLLMILLMVIGPNA